MAHVLLGSTTMAVRITRSAEGQSTLLRVDGRLTQDDVPALQAECHSAQGTLHLDLGNLTHADAAGVRALRALMEGGARLEAVTPFIELLLQEPNADER
jgi:ABC-type transporter Mla MlaB component